MMTNSTTTKHKVAILSGSFNPLHIGHVAIANYVVEYTDVDELWFVVSPHNPLKQVVGLLPEIHRLKMVEIAVSKLSLPFKACDIEMHLPKPSYTIDTLNALQAKHPDCEFTFVMGGDSIADIERWKDYQTLLQRFRIFVYPRPACDNEALCRGYGVTLVNAPLMDISATFIRHALSEGRNVAAFLPCGVYEYIKEYNLYI